MSEILSIKVEGVEEDILKKISFFSSNNRVRLMNEIGFNIQERTADHIARASVTRHKTADRLGAPHTGFLEFAPGRIRSEGKYSNPDGTRPYTGVESVTPNSVTVVVGNTPGMSRAFHPLVIMPKKAKALTIPINAVSYGKTVKEVEGGGWKIHRQGKVLVGKRGKEEKKMFALLGKVVVPQDRGLLPTEQDIQEWGADTVEAFAEMNLQN